jgi:GNAT superfamily N-acetyltransferase
MNMQFMFRVVSTAGDRFEFDMLQRIVFGRDVDRFPIPLRAPRESVMRILAYSDDRSSPVGGLTVVDTTEDALSHFAYGVPAASITTTAFYGGMAVLPEYRGLSIPVRLIFEAQRLFVRPRGIECTWLLYPADRVPHARLCRILDYRPLPGVVYEIDQPSRVLIRMERREQARRINTPSCLDTAVREHNALRN